jgi:hypothetical protein
VISPKEIAVSEGQSTTSPLFENSAEEVANRLEAHRSDVAMAMAQEARQLVEEFRAWRTRRPLDHVRIAAIRQLFDLHRRAMDYLAQQPHMPNGDAPPSGGYRR